MSVEAQTSPTLPIQVDRRGCSDPSDVARLTPRTNPGRVRPSRPYVVRASVRSLFVGVVAVRFLEREEHPLPLDQGVGRIIQFADREQLFALPAGPLEEGPDCGRTPFDGCVRGVGRMIPSCPTKIRSSPTIRRLVRTGRHSPGQVVITERLGNQVQLS